MIWFIIPIIISIIMVVRMFISKGRKNLSVGNYIIFLMNLSLGVMIGFLLYIIIGGIIAYSLPSEKIIITSYPIYSIDESEFILNIDKNDDYYISNGQEIKTFDRETTELKTTDSNPKYELTRYKFYKDDIVAFLFGSDTSLNIQKTLYIPRNTIFK